MVHGVHLAYHPVVGAARVVQLPAEIGTRGEVGEIGQGGGRQQRGHRDGHPVRLGAVAGDLYPVEMGVLQTVDDVTAARGGAIHPRGVVNGMITNEIAEVIEACPGERDGIGGHIHHRQVGDGGARRTVIDGEIIHRDVAPVVDVHHEADLQQGQGVGQWKGIPFVIERRSCIGEQRVPLVLVARPVKHPESIDHVGDARPAEVVGRHVTRKLEIGMAHGGNVHQRGKDQAGVARRVRMGDMTEHTVHSLPTVLLGEGERPALRIRTRLLVGRAVRHEDQTGRGEGHGTPVAALASAVYPNSQVIQCVDVQSRKMC